jgi:hypothetical protein
MTSADEPRIDIESTDDYVRPAQNGILQLEPVDSYVKRVTANIKLSKAKAANWIGYTLVFGVVSSLYLYVWAVMASERDVSEQLATVFSKWYDVVGPLLGAVIGALFGMSIASRQQDEAG